MEGRESEYKRGISTSDARAARRNRQTRLKKDKRKQRLQQFRAAVPETGLPPRGIDPAVLDEMNETARDAPLDSPAALSAFRYFATVAATHKHWDVFRERPGLVEKAAKGMNTDLPVSEPCAALVSSLCYDRSGLMKDADNNSATMLNFLLYELEILPTIYRCALEHPAPSVRQSAARTMGILCSTNPATTNFCMNNDMPQAVRRLYEKHKREDADLASGEYQFVMWAIEAMVYFTTKHSYEEFMVLWPPLKEGLFHRDHEILQEVCGALKTLCSRFPHFRNLVRNPDEEGPVGLDQAKKRLARLVQLPKLFLGHESVCEPIVHLLCFLIHHEGPDSEDKAGMRAPPTVARLLETGGFKQLSVLAQSASARVRALWIDLMGHSISSDPAALDYFFESRAIHQVLETCRGRTVTRLELNAARLVLADTVLSIGLGRLSQRASFVDNEVMQRVGELLSSGDLDDNYTGLRAIFAFTKAFPASLLAWAEHGVYDQVQEFLMRSDVAETSKIMQIALSLANAIEDAENRDCY